jgi:hypothetical protein
VTVVVDGFKCCGSPTSQTATLVVDAPETHGRRLDGQHHEGEWPGDRGYVTDRPRHEAATRDDGGNDPQPHRFVSRPRVERQGEKLLDLEAVEPG